MILDKTNTEHISGKEDGIAFMWVLFLLVIMSALSLAFLQKVSIGTSATVTRGTGMQTQYLAEAAANHALWRLLNDPSFNPSETNYYMHSLAGGRYGYKVRKPTMTTFGTVATVGGVSNAATHQSYVQYLRPYDIITTYEPYGGEDIPVFRQLLGATWVDPADTLSVGPNDAQWMALKGCPIRKEMIMGTLDSANDINFAVWEGTTWGNLTEFTQDTGAYSYMAFDIAYENQSGDALVVGRYDGSAGVRYNTWYGSAWAFGTPQEDANLSPEGESTYVDMASKPNSNEILIALVQADNDLKVVQWDGAAFIDHGEIDDDMATADYGSAEVVYEQQSGDALVLWGHKSASELYYSVWSGASLSPVAHQLPYDFGGIPYVIRAAADPTSNYIFVAAVDKSFDLNVAVWDGNAWIDSREISTGVCDDEGQVLDVAWEHSGEGVIVAWPPSAGNNVNYFSWRKGTALTDHAVQVGPDFQAVSSLVRLLPISGTQKIILLVKNDSRDLRYSLWSGNTFIGDPPILLESNFGLGMLPFDVAESGVTYTGGSG